MFPHTPETRVEVEMPPVKPPRKEITFKVSRLTKPWALKGTESAIRALAGNALDNFDVKVEINKEPRKMKTNPRNPVIAKIKTKPNPNYWKHKFMQVLEAMADNELSWAKNHWAEYGITEQDKENIEREFERQVRWREKRGKVDLVGEIEG